MWTKVRTRHIIDQKLIIEEVYYCGDLRGINFSTDWRFRTIPMKRCQASIVEVQDHHIMLRKNLIDELRNANNSIIT